MMNEDILMMMMILIKVIVIIMIKIIGADNCKYGVDNYDDIDDGRIDDDDNKEEDDR